MPLENKETLLHEAARKVFEEATTLSLGSPCNTVIVFHLKKKFGKDPYEVFTDDPKEFFKGLEEVFGAAAECMVGLIGAFIVRKYEIACTAEEFVALVVKGDELSKRRLREILFCVASQDEKKC